MLSEVGVIDPAPPPQFKVIVGGLGPYQTKSIEKPIVSSPKAIKANYQ